MSQIALKDEMDIASEKARFDKELADFKKDYKNQKAAHDLSIAQYKNEFDNEGGKEKQYDEEMQYYAKAVEDTIAEGIESVVEAGKSK